MERPTAPGEVAGYLPKRFVVFLAATALCARCIPPLTEIFRAQHCNYDHHYYYLLLLLLLLPAVSRSTRRAAEQRWHK